MKIETIDISKINPAVYNPRKDLKTGDPEYEHLKKSINEFGCVEPLIWNKRTGNLVGGHQRLKLLKERGDTEVQVSVVDLPDNKEKALNIALNKISGEWDMPLLKDLLEELDTGDFDMDLTGFTSKEIEDLMTQFHVDFSQYETPGKDEIQKTDNELKNRFTNLSKDNEGKMIQLICPHCGTEYFISRDDIDKVSSV
jgi:ParB-like chromosome segregation protein Spo0J